MTYFRIHEQKKESDEAKRENFQNEFDSTAQSTGLIFYSLREQGSDPNIP